MLSTSFSATSRKTQCLARRPGAPAAGEAEGRRQRICALRQEGDLKQVQLAEILGVSQQTIVSFEKGIRRVPVSALPTLASAFGISVEELLGTPAKGTKRGPTSKLQQQFERVARLPKTRQRFVSEMIDAVLQQAGV